MEPTRKIEKVGMRNLRMEDYDQLAKSFKRIYADSDVFWTKEQIKKLITIFPEGQVVIIVDDKIVGCALSIIVNYNMVKGDHTYAQVTVRVMKPSIPTILMETFFTASRYLSILIIVVCAWLAVCMSIARNSARSSI